MSQERHKDAPKSSFPVRGVEKKPILIARWPKGIEPDFKPNRIRFRPGLQAIGAESFTSR